VPGSVQPYDLALLQADDERGLTIPTAIQKCRLRMINAVHNAEGAAIAITAIITSERRNSEPRIAQYKHDNRHPALDLQPLVADHSRRKANWKSIIANKPVYLAAKFLARILTYQHEYDEPLLPGYSS